ncbi:MAG: hypothetical protein N2Z62_16615 [Rhodobacteraceae bacterium]|nr:hypothetical protein [Paracoccaceae bacterium]
MSRGASLLFARALAALAIVAALLAVPPAPERDQAARAFTAVFGDGAICTGMPGQDDGHDRTCLACILAHALTPSAPAGAAIPCEPPVALAAPAAPAPAASRHPAQAPPARGPPGAPFATS